MCDPDNIINQHGNYVTYDQLVEKMEEQKDFIDEVLKWVFFRIYQSIVG